MAEGLVLYELKNSIATITVNRPERYNALNITVKKELLKLFKQSNEDESVKVVILTGQGEKAFISGADVTEFVGRSSETITEVVDPSRAVAEYMSSMNKPIIGAINGYALGGGCELALACDIRYASSNARFGFPEVNLGTIPGNGGIVRLPRLVGLGIAKEMILTGKIIPSEEAYRIGLVNKLFDSVESLRIGALELAETLTTKPQIAVMLANRTLDRTVDTSFQEHSKLEYLAFRETFDTSDIKEGVAAFLEKRHPKFKNK
ncbi:MAG: enoyl-CoA hydratase/isomerase family protein [Candidatus Thorarchaeota archaeon]